MYTEWQPIETCPSEHVLFYGRTLYDSGIVFDGWRDTKGIFCTGDGNLASPTHWMPLPHTPVAGS